MELKKKDKAEQKTRRLPRSRHIVGYIPDVIEAETEEDALNQMKQFNVFTTGTNGSSDQLNQESILQKQTTHSSPPLFPATHNITKRTPYEFQSSKDFDDEQKLMYRSMLEFYAHKTYIEDILLPSVQWRYRSSRRYKLSRRLINNAVTTFATNSRVPIEWKTKDGQEFSLSTSYDAHLPKKNFDPFRRGPRLLFPFGVRQWFNTTLGQLNFFAWSIRYEVLDFCAKKQMEIKEHAKQQKKRKQLKREQKKSEVSTQQQTPPSQNNDQSDKTISMLMSNHPVKKKPKQTKATNNNMDMVNRQTIHETNVQSSLTDASLENKETRIPKRKKSIKSLSSKPKTQTTTSRKRSRIARNSFLLIQTQYTVEPQMEI